MNAEAVAPTQAQPQADNKQAPQVNPQDNQQIKDGRVSNKFQALVQREKQALEVERRAKQTQADLDTRLKAFEEREKRVSDFESLKTKDPIKALELLGLSYQDLTQVALNDGSVPPEVQVRKVEEKLDTFLKSQEAAEKERAESAQRLAKQQEEKVISDFKGEINNHIESNQKDYEFIKFEGLQDIVYEIIDEHYNRTLNPDTGVGEIMNIKDAADKLEKQLEKKYEDAKKLQKFQAQPQQLAQKLAQNVAKPQVFKERPQAVRTLTNQLSATPAAPRTRPLTDQERVAKAVAYARGLRP